MAKLLKKLYKNLKQNLHLRSKLHRLFAVLFVLCLIIVPAIEIKNAEVKHPMAQYFYTAKINDNCGSGIVHYDFYREIKICSWFKDYEIGDAKTFTFEVGEYRYNRCYYLHRPIDLFERRESLAKLIADTSNLWPELAHLIERQREANRSELARLSNPSGGQYRNIELCNSGMAQNKNEFDSSFQFFKIEVDKLYSEFYGEWTKKILISFLHGVLSCIALLASILVLKWIIAPAERDL